jgi:hypothetical protein
LKARNDLLHVDAFPSRPTNGWRILRLFVNINPSESRVWVTSDPSSEFFARYGESAGLPGQVNRTWLERAKDTTARWFRPGRPRRSAYDAFMLRFHDFLKKNDQFQAQCPKRFWSFVPGSMWLAITDTASHAVLHGRYALEHSFFINPADLVLPDQSPASILARGGASQVEPRCADRRPSAPLRCSPRAGGRALSEQACEQGRECRFAAGRGTQKQDFLTSVKVEIGLGYPACSHSAGPERARQPPARQRGTPCDQFRVLLSAAARRPSLRRTCAA